ncbi:hypothetical protein KJ632_02580, partial [Patescibacteria group bacterium]|nr:hypothetical protein [Patescibacteria group bacterium]
MLQQFKTKTKFLILLLLLSLMIGQLSFLKIFSNEASALSVPHYLGYEGHLTDSSDDALTGTYSMTFTIYDALSAGATLWTETQSVTVTNGYFGVQLGSVTSLDLDFSSAYWLGVTVGTDSEMTPRSPINAVGYSYASDLSFGAYSTTSAPTSPNGGAIYYNSTDGNIYVYDDVAASWVDLTTATTMAENLTIDKADPSIILNATTAGDTDFWISVVEDALGDDNDYLRIGDGATPGTNTMLSLDTTGKLGIGKDAPEVGLHLGSGSGSHSLTSNNDGFISGNLEVDGMGYLDGGLTAAGILDLTGSVLSGASPLIFEGLTANDYETTITVTDPTADRTLTLPDASGTIALTSDLGSYQTLDTGLTSISGLTTAADKMIYTTASDTYATTDLTAFVRTILDDADAAAVKTTLSLNNVENTALSTWVGTSSITTLGTITSGVWNGT